MLRNPDMDAGNDEAQAIRTLECAHFIQDTRMLKIKLELGSTLFLYQQLGKLGRKWRE